MRNKTQNETSEILQKLNDTKQKLNDAYAEFNTTLEPELIDASVFEISSLQARYAYLFRLAKEIQDDNTKSAASKQKCKSSKADVQSPSL